MAWKPKSMGAGKARLYKIEAIVKQAIPDLRDHLAYDPETSYIITEFERQADDGSGPRGAITPASVNIGDLEVMPLIKFGAIQIRIEGAGHREGLAVTSQRAYIEGGTKDEFFTSIYGYIHPDALRDERNGIQGRQRSLLQETILDWMRARIFNFLGPLPDGSGTVDYRQLTLISKERYPDNIDRHDVLSNCKLMQGHKCYVQRQFGDEVVHGVEAVHYGILQG